MSEFDSGAISGIILTSVVWLFLCVIPIRVEMNKSWERELVQKGHAAYITDSDGNSVFKLKDLGELNEGIK